MRDFKRLVKGVLLKDNNGGSNPIGDLSGVLTAADNGAIYNYQNRVRAFLDGAEREIITDDQSQTLTNKTIDVDNNTISNIETDNLKAGVLNTNVDLTGASDTQIPSVLAVKTYIDNRDAEQDAASEITFDNTIANLSPAPAYVQGAIDLIDGDLDNVITLTGVARDSEDLGTFTGDTIDVAAPAGPKTIKQALQALESAHDALSEAQGTTDGKVTDLITLSGVAANAENLGSFTGDTINGNPEEFKTIKGALQALETAHETHVGDTEAHGATGAVVGTTNEQTLTNKTLEAGRIKGITLVEDYISEESENSDISGASAVILSPSKPIVRLINASLISVAGISALEYQIPSTIRDFGGVLTVVNATLNDIDILNNAGGATDSILTGTDDDITLAPDAAILLKYDVTTNKFRIIGGTGSGSVIIKALAGENLTAREAVYLSVGAADSGRLQGRAYKLDSSNDNRIEYVGLVKATVTSGQTAKIITGGVVKGFTGLSVGVPVYLDTITPGAYTQTEPTTSQRWIIRLGIAISSTQVMILQDQGMTAFFNEEVQADITINNNVSSATNVSNLVFDGAVANRFIVDYGLFRSTDTESLAQAGRLRGVYNEDDAQWYLSDDYSGQNAGVTFSITAGGQIQYTSSNLSGTGYVGTLQYRISIGDGVHVLGVMEADGDLITRISGVNARLPIGSQGSILKVNLGLPSWLPVGASGTAIVSNGSDSTYGYPDQLSTASGSAPSYAARAWVNFQGTTAGTNPAPMTIRASGNISSVTRTGTGEFTINFTAQIQDTNYSVSGFATYGPSTAPAGLLTFGNNFTPQTTSVPVRTANAFDVTLQNAPHVHVIIFR